MKKRFTVTSGYVTTDGYTPVEGKTTMASTTVPTSGYVSLTAENCGHCLPCGLCRLINAPCPMRQMEHSEVTCSNTEVK